MNAILRGLLLPKPPLLLSTLKIEREISDDAWNKMPMGAISCHISTHDGVAVGDFNYRRKTGQVGGMFLAGPFRCQALEQQMLIYMMKDMQDAGAKQIWKVVPKEENTGDKFYSALWSFQFKDSRQVHPSVTGMGYAMDIPHDLRSLVVMPGIGIYERAVAAG